MIQKNVFTFLDDLKKHNERDWFNTNKSVYLEAHENVISFADELRALLLKHDNIETASGKKSLHRIYRDVRFSKDKTPYSTHFGGGFARATKLLRGGYYFHIEPGNTLIAGGFWSPESNDLKRIREAITADSSELRTIIDSKPFKDNFGELHGDQLKTSPAGYTIEHPDIDLLRYKQFLVYRKFSDKEALDKNFAQLADSTFKAMRPFFDYMSEVLTTDENGELIV